MEFVFVVPRHELFSQCAPHGFQPFAGPEVEQAFAACVEERGFFVERPYAERTPQLKQVIPYTLVRRGDAVLCLRRTKQGGEARLHDKLSIGVGGHINPIDLPQADETHTGRRPSPIAKATQREVTEEELRISGEYTLRALGLINDDTNPVGAVHVGLVQVLTTLGDVEIRETDQLAGDFVPIRELEAMLARGENFESWSSLLIPHLDRVLSQTPDDAAALTDADARVTQREAVRS